MVKQAPVVTVTKNNSEKQTLKAERSWDGKTDDGTNTGNGTDPETKSAGIPLEAEPVLETMIPEQLYRRRNRCRGTDSGGTIPARRLILRRNRTGEVLLKKNQRLKNAQLAISSCYYRLIIFSGVMTVKAASTCNSQEILKQSKTQSYLRLSGIYSLLFYLKVQFAGRTGKLLQKCYKQGKIQVTGEIEVIPISNRKGSCMSASLCVPRGSGEDPG